MIEVRGVRRADAADRLVQELDDAEHLLCSHERCVKTAADADRHMRCETPTLKSENRRKNNRLGVEC